MSFNFGGFAAGLSNGFGSGVRMGKTMRDILKERKMEETLATAREEAAAAYDAKNTSKSASVTEGPANDGQAYKAESGAVVTPVRTSEVVSTGLAPLGQETAAPSVATQTPAAPTSGADGNAGEAEARMVKPTPQQTAAAGVAGAPAEPGAAKYTAGSGTFDTRKQAEMAAGVKNDPAARSTYIQKNMATKAQEYLVSIGDIDGAEKYGKHAESLAGKQAIKDWADAKSAPDIDTRAASFGRYYTDHVNDGVDYTGHKILTKEDGTQVAVVALKDKKTGKTSEMELTDDKMLQLGDAWNPAAVFKNEQARAASASAQKAKVGEEVFKSKLRMGEEKYKADRLDAREGLKASNAQTLEDKKGQQNLSEISLRGQIEAQNVGEKSKAELTAKTEALKAAGYTDEEIKPLVPMLLKAGEFKKGTSPEERRDIWITEITKNNPKIKEDALNKQLEIMERARGGVKPSEPGASPAAAKPAASTEQKFRNPQAPGRLFVKKGNEYVDVGPDPLYKPKQPAPAQAGGVPPRQGGASGGF